MGFTTTQKQGFGGILYLFAFCQVCSRILAVPDLDEGVWEGQQTVSTISFDLLLAYSRRDCRALPTSYVYDPAWTQAKILRRKDGYNGLYLHSPRHQLPVANRSVMLTLCIILSNDVQLNPGPPTSHRCAICDKSVAKKDRGIMCDECGMDVHIDCAGVPKRYFKRLKTEGKDWFCKACWAPCGMCDGDIFDGDKGLECDVCNKWIHPLCCGIDSKAYELLQSSRFGWICPTCNASNYADAFFTTDDLPDVYNPFTRLPDETNCSKHRSSYSSRSISDVDGVATNLDDTVSGSVPAMPPSFDKPDDTAYVTNRSTKSKKPGKTRSSRNKIRCILINCRSIKNKVADFEVLEEIHKPDLVCGVESWLNETIYTSEIFPNIFSVFRNDRTTETTGGGVFQAIRNDLISTHSQDLTTECEIIWTETQINGRKPLLIGTYYRADDQQGDMIDQLDLSISKLGDKINTHDVILVGDFNLPNIDWDDLSAFSKSGYSKTAAEKLVNLSVEHGLTQCVTEATRKQGDTENILDLVFTNNPDSIQKITITDGIADHFNVVIDLDIAPKVKRRAKRKIFIRKKADTDNIKKAMDKFQQEYFDPVNQSLGVNEKWEFIRDNLTSIMNRFVPSKMSSSRYNLPWFNSTLRKQCRKKQKLYNKAEKSCNSSDWDVFTAERRSFKKNLRTARSKYYSEYLETSLKDEPKSFWSYIKNLRQEHQGIADLKNGTNVVSNSKDKAQVLNQQFTSVFTKEGPGELPELGEPYPSIPKLNIVTEGVEAQLRRLNPSKAQGPDELPPWFLSMIASELAPIYQNLFQCSVDSGQVPDQ